MKRSASRARTSPSGQNWPRRSSLPMSPIGMTSMKVRSISRAAHQAASGNRSSSLTPFNATVLIFTRSPALCAASIPSSTCGSRPQRVIAANFAGSSVSSETLTRRTPASASSTANRASCEPLVVSVSSFSAPDRRCRDRARKSVMMFRRTSGSPPVMRSFSTPSRTKAEQSRSSSSSVSSSRLGRNSIDSAMQ